MRCLSLVSISSLSLALTLSLSVAQAQSNVTAEFQTGFNTKLGPDLSALKAYDVILVTGYLNEKQIDLMGWDIFAPQKEILDRAGVSYQRFTYDEDRLAVNARALSEVIAKSTKPVILIAHSLGAQLALEALLVDGRFDQASVAQTETTDKNLMNICGQVLDRLSWLGAKPTIDVWLGKSAADCAAPVQLASPSIRAKVAALLTLNGNIAGTPLADYLFDDRSTVIDTALQTYLNIRPSTLAISIFEMSPAVAGARLSDKKAELAELVAAIPVLSVTATYAAQLEADGSPKSKTDRLSLVLAEHGVSQADAVVPTDNAIVPGANFVVLNQVSHFEMVKDFEDMNIDNRRATEVLLQMLVGRLPKAN